MIGVFYGKSLFGRPLLQDLHATSIKFYPQWRDGAGRYHDHYNKTPLFVLNNTIADEFLLFYHLLMDDHSLTRYISQFGGIWEFTNLSLELDDKTTVTLGKLEIQLIKLNNELTPESSLITVSQNYSHYSNNAMLTIDLGVTVTPWFFVDNILYILGVVSLPVLIALLIRRRIQHVRRFRAMHAQSPPVGCA